MCASSILFQNEEKTVFVLDLPLSIALAQVTEPQPVLFRHLLSCSPVEIPHQSIEPKGPKAIERVLSSTTSSDKSYHSGIQDSIRRSLQEVHASYSGPWYLPRQLPDGQIERQRPGRCDPGSRSSQRLGILPPLILSPSSTEFTDLGAIRDTIVVNFNYEGTQLKTAKDEYWIPPMSAFLLSDVHSSAASFTFYVNSLFENTNHSKYTTFDIVVLDPPWANRSIRRSGAYNTSEHQPKDPFDAVQFVFEKHVSIGGIVAIWITNKETIRTRVVQNLRQSSFEVAEEWIWVKVAASKEPITSLEGVWRHPYEICLIFRRSSMINRSGHQPIRRRIVIANPDLHSRKPSLKQLLALIFPEKTGKLCLEIFARNLTAGWLSWGDQVLLYANEQGWRIQGES